MHSQHIEAAKQESRSADAALEEANSQVEDLSGRLLRLQEDLAREKEALKALEAEAIGARAEGRSVKISALDNSRGAVRITSEAIEVVESQLNEARETWKSCESAAKVARRRAEVREAGILLFEMAPILEEIVTRLHNADPHGNGHVIYVLNKIVGHYSPLSNSTLKYALASAALEIAYGKGSEARAAVNGTIQTLTIDREIARRLPRAAQDND
ncbi:MAG: hypothetical protein AB7S74_07360 [Hyphomicrobium sp.]